MIIIPAAGEGRRFKEAGYDTPKHFLPLLGKDMIELVIDSVRPLDPKGEVYVVTQDWVGKTAGAVDTVLRAWARLLATTSDGGAAMEREPLIVANCDQLVALPDGMTHGWGNGLVFTFPSANTAHSYVTTGRGGKITGIVEKPANPPTNQAVSGVYAFTMAGQFIEACMAVHGKRPVTRQTGEEYISSAIAKLIEWGYVLYAVEVPTAILGTPEDYQRFETAAHVLRSMESRS